MIWLVILLIVNAAISAGYYLRIIGTMFLRPEASYLPEPPDSAATRMQVAVALGVIFSVAGTIAFGTIPAMTQGLVYQATHSPPERPVSVSR